MKNKIILPTFILMGSLLLPSCSAYNQLQDKVIVRFESTYGFKIADQLLDRGSLVEEPYQEAAGYNFHGWYLTNNPQANEIPWNFNQDRAENSIILYAYWTEKTYTITFQSNGGSTFNPISFVMGSLLDMPVPLRFGFTFGGWYEDPQFTTQFYPSNIQAKNYLLYAKWLPYPTVDALFVTTNIQSSFITFANQIANQTATPIRFKSAICSSDCSNLDALEASLNSDNAPVFFQLPFNGRNTLALLQRFTPYMVDLSNQSWVDLTNVALWHQQKVYGFPLVMKADGLVYNTEIINRYNRLSNVTPIDPNNWFNYENLAKAMVSLHARKDELGIKSVVSFSPDMPIDPLFNAYLSMGKSSQDQSVLTDLNLGRYPTFRIDEYANWLKLLTDFSDQSGLFRTTLAGQVSAFMAEETAIMPYVPTFDVELKNFFAIQHFAMAPLGQFSTNAWSLAFNSQTSWIFINRKADSTQIDFLKSLLFEYATNTSMRIQVSNNLGTLHPFKNDLIFSNNNQFNQTIVPFYNRGATNPYLFDRLANTTKVNALVTLHNQWFLGMINRHEFVRQLKAWVENYP